MNIEWVFFDWGGTLADVSGQSVALYAGARAAVDILLGRSDDALIQDLARRALTAEHHAAADPELREVDIHRLLADWACEHDTYVDAPLLDRAVATVAQAWVGSLAPLPGARETLETLRDRGYRLGLVSNVWIPAEACQRGLERLGFAEFLDFVVFSSQVGYRKPARQVYEQALLAAFGQQRPNDLSSVLFVGDSPLCDIAAPARLGMKTVLIQTQDSIQSLGDILIEPDFRLANVSELLDKLS